MTQQNISRMAEAWRIISRKQTTQANQDNATRMAYSSAGSASSPSMTWWRLSRGVTSF